MALTSTLLHVSPLVQIRHVVCTPEQAGCSDLECPACHSIAFPLAGVFLKHTGRDEQVVADRQHAIFFRPGVPYRVSHPAGGDRCLAFDLSPQVLEELGISGDRSTSNAAPMTRRLSGEAMLLKHRLYRALQAQETTALQAEEATLSLVASCQPADSGRSAMKRRRSNRRHLVRRIEATLLALSTEPERAWTLMELAHRVHSSPWHLARMFRRHVGTTLHQFQLRARLAEALDPVLEGGTNLAELAANLGFSSHSHFTSAFRRAFGYTPTELRRETGWRGLRPVRVRYLDREQQRFVRGMAD